MNSDWKKLLGFRNMQEKLDFFFSNFLLTLASFYLRFLHHVLSPQKRILYFFLELEAFQLCWTPAVVSKSIPHYQYLKFLLYIFSFNKGRKLCNPTKTFKNIWNDAMVMFSTISDFLGTWSMEKDFTTHKALTREK